MPKPPSKDSNGVSAALSCQSADVVLTLEHECRICHAPGPHSLYVAREMMFGWRDRFEYFECALCGCLQIREFPVDISNYYPNNYYAHKLAPDVHFANPIRAAFIKARARYDLSGRGLVGRLISNVKPEFTGRSLRSLNPTSDSSILDVGCGNGMRLYLLRELGFRNLLGIDPFIDRGRTYNNGLRIEKASLASMTGTWDIIMFHHSFEHLDCPLDTLRHVHRLLKPSGRCMIRIPVAGSYAWRSYQTDWVQLDAPRHYFLHTPASIRYLAGEGNLRITSVSYDSTEFQFWGSELYRRDIPLKDHPNMFSKSILREFRARAEQLNTLCDGDSAAFYLAHSNLPAAGPTLESGK